MIEQSSGTPSAITGHITVDGKQVQQFDIPATGKLSEAVMQLKQQATQCLTAQMQQPDQSKEDVDLMEEPEDMIEDDLAHVLPKQKNKKKPQAAGKRKR